MNTSRLKVVAHLGARHKASCAEHDPTPGYCDCGATQEPLVKLSDVLALVESSRPSPPQRTWFGLTDEEIKDLVKEFDGLPITLSYAIEAKLKENNT